MAAPLQTVSNISQSTVIQKASRQGAITVHGWVYSLETGHLRDLQCGEGEWSDGDEEVPVPVMAKVDVGRARVVVGAQAQRATGVKVGLANGMVGAF